MPRKDLIQYRRGTAAEWASVNPVLAAAEVGYDLTNNEIRVGNGTARWADLDPIGGTVSEEQIAQVVQDYLDANPIDLSGYVQTDDARLSDARAPLAHTQAISTVTGLEAALAGKADLDTLTEYATTEEVGDALADKADQDDPRFTDARTPLPHSHAISDVTGLQDELDSKDAPVTSVNEQTGAVVLDASDIEVAGGITVYDSIATHIPAAVNSAAQTAEWDNVSGRPVIPDPEDFATAAQGVLADAAVQPSNLRLPIILTQAAYDELDPPVAGQVYITQG